MSVETEEGVDGVQNPLVGQVGGQATPASMWAPEIRRGPAEQDQMMQGPQEAVAGQSQERQSVRWALETRRQTARGTWSRGPEGRQVSTFARTSGSEG